MNWSKIKAHFRKWQGIYTTAIWLTAYLAIYAAGNASGYAKGRHLTNLQAQAVVEGYMAGYHEGKCKTLATEGKTQ